MQYMSVEEMVEYLHTLPSDLFNFLVDTQRIVDTRGLMWAISAVNRANMSQEAKARNIKYLVEIYGGGREDVPGVC